MPMTMKERSLLGVAARKASFDRRRFRRYAEEMKASTTVPDEATQTALAEYLRRQGWAVRRV